MTSTPTTTNNTQSSPTTQLVHVPTDYGNLPVSYYHCEPPASDDAPLKSKRQQQLVLLHGARFTKEDWKTSGILQSFCQQQDDDLSLSVTALDLSVMSSYADLVHVLQQLQTSKVLSLPVQGIVTPSASGKAIMEGLVMMTNSNSKKNGLPALPDLTERWIPVACLGLMQLQKSIVLPPSWPILAIHGDQDKPGKQSSELLFSLRNKSGSSSSNSQQQEAVTVKELPGRHPCYLDSPIAFVQAVIAFLKET